MTIVDQLPATITQAPNLAAVSPEDFEFLIAEARKKAQTLVRIVENPDKPLFSMIQGNKHLHVEAWKTIARGYGYDIDIISSGPLEGGGYEAKAEVRDGSGTIVGHGDAECGSRGDGMWMERPAYAQRSMAQTRAIARAGRNTLDWVVVLAGYTATPKEEMPDPDEPQRQSPPSNNQQQQNFTPELCPEHNTDWFQKGKMQHPAHPVNGPDGKQLLNEKGGPQWCNMGDWVKWLGERSVVIRENMAATEGNAWVKEFIATDNPGKWNMIRSAEERASRDEPLFEEPEFDDFEPSR